MKEVEAAAGLAVRGADAVAGAAAARQLLVDAGVPGLLAEKDPTLWGEAAESEAKIRLGWVDTVRRSRELLPAAIASAQSGRYAASNPSRAPRAKIVSGPPYQTSACGLAFSERSRS